MFRARPCIVCSTLVAGLRSLRLRITRKIRATGARTRKEGLQAGPSRDHQFGHDDGRGHVQPKRHDFGGARWDDFPAIARTPVVVPTSLAARRLRACQQSPHRQTAVHVPARVCSRVKRHPKELVSVRSGLVSGEQTPQSAQVSMASIRIEDARPKNAHPITANGQRTQALSSIFGSVTAERRATSIRHADRDVRTGIRVCAPARQSEIGGASSPTARSLRRLVTRLRNYIDDA